MSDSRREGILEGKPTYPSTDPHVEATDSPKLPESSHRFDHIRDQVIHDAFVEARQQLLSTRLSNPLISFQYSRGKKGVQIVDEKSDPIYELLVENEKTLSFAPSLSGEDEFDPHLLTQPLKVRGKKEKLTSEHQDRVLQTTHPELNLQSRLLATSADARLYRAERGAHSLFLALGMLHWKDTEKGESHRAPLLLVPVEVNRKSASENFEVAYKGQDIEENLVLRRRFREEFGIELPALPTGSDLKPSKYFRQVLTCLRDAGLDFDIHSNEITLGFFSFGNQLMYNDLNPDLWPAGRKPDEHRIFRSLFGGGFQNAPSLIPEGSSVDQYVNPAQRFNVLPADSSQARLLEEVRAGRDKIGAGPPGTGKSTTIVNMIGNALSEGKKVLFVSEKEDAIRVVRNWMYSAGIGETCIELHGSTTRKSFAEQLGNTLELGNPTEVDRKAITDSLELERVRLNEHARLMHQEVRRSGFRAFEVLENCAAMGRDTAGRVNLRDPSMLEWTRADYAQVRDIANAIQKQCARIGTPARHLFHGVGVESLGELDTDTFEELLQKSLDVSTRYSEKLNEVFSALGLDCGASEDFNDRTLLALHVIDDLFTNEGEMLRGVPLDSPDWVKHGKSLRAAVQDELRYAKILEQTDGEINLSALAGANLEVIEQTIREHKDRFWKIFNSGYKQARATLKSITDLPASYDEQIELTQNLADLQKLQKASGVNVRLWDSVLGRSWRERRTEGSPHWIRTAQLVNQLTDFSAASHGHPEAKQLVSLLLEPKKVYEKSEKLKELFHLHRQWKDCRAQVFRALQLSEESQRVRFLNRDVDSQRELISGWRHGLDRLGEYLEYMALTRRAADIGCGFIKQRVQSWDLVGSNLVKSLDASYFETLAEDFINAEGLAARFSGRAHDEIVSSYREHAEQMQRANAVAIATRHWEQIPRFDAGGQSGILHHEVKKKSGHIPLREFLLTAGDAIQAAKPVFLMSPQAVAKHLDPAGIRFDLVIFDEGSQLRPTHAFGAMLRADQVVVVGDRQQLPPTPFFERGAEYTYGSDEDEEENVESVLDLLGAARMSEHNLNWHYRSRRPGLIQVSNEEMYEGELRVFPGAERGELAHGISYHPIDSGTYERGRGTNQKEAQAVAAAIMAHARDYPSESLGVVAMNRAQSELIRLELEKLRRLDPTHEDFFGEDSEPAYPFGSLDEARRDGESRAIEPFFIKNLENVQGDERDRMIISMVYGKDDHGKFSLNFGPINGKGGERRLNVLISRARNWCDVFSSMDPDWKDFDRSDNRGVKVMRSYLRHARDGADKARELEASRKVRPLQRVIQAELKAKGYEVHTNIGPEGCHLELAVVHPKDPSRYILAIQSDGPQYQAVESARERDVLIPQVLQARGIGVKRIWALDWYRDPKGQLREIEQAVKEALRVERIDRSKAVSAGRELRFIERAKATKKEPKLVVAYEPVQLRSASIRDDLEEVRKAQTPARSPLERLSEALATVVREEGPVHRDIAHKRLLEAAGVSKKTDSYDYALSLAANRAISSGRISAHGDFLYETSETEVEPRSRAKLKGKERSFVYVSPEEVEALIIRIVRHSHGISANELSKQCAVQLGYKSMPQGADAIISNRIHALIQQDILTDSAGSLGLGKAHN